MFKNVFGENVKKTILVGAVALAVTGCSTTSSGSMSSPEVQMLAACEQYLGQNGKLTRAFCDCFKSNMNTQINNSGMTSAEKAAQRQNIEDVYNQCVASTSNYTNFANTHRPA